MPVGMTVKVEGLNTLHAKMAAWPKLQHKHVRAGIGKIGLDMVRNWKQELSGPRSQTRLGVVSGNLRASVAAQFVPGHYAAVDVGTSLPYGAIHELGFDGTVSVRAHERKGHAVRAHDRHMRMPKRPHMRPAIRSTVKRMPPIIRAQYREFLNELRRIRRAD